MNIHITRDALPINTSISTPDGLLQALNAIKTYRHLSLAQTLDNEKCGGTVILHVQESEKGWCFNKKTVWTLNAKCLACEQASTITFDKHPSKTKELRSWLSGHVSHIWDSEDRNSFSFYVSK